MTIKGQHERVLGMMEIAGTLTVLLVYESVYVLKNLQLCVLVSQFYSVIT